MDFRLVADRVCQRFEALSGLEPVPFLNETHSPSAGFRLFFEKMAVLEKREKTSGKIRKNGISSPFSGVLFCIGKAFL